MNNHKKMGGWQRLFVMFSGIYLIALLFYSVPQFVEKYNFYKQSCKLTALEFKNRVDGRNQMIFLPPQSGSLYYNVNVEECYQMKRSEAINAVKQSIPNFDFIEYENEILIKKGIARKQDIENYRSKKGTNDLDTILKILAHKTDIDELISMYSNIDYSTAFDKFNKCIEEKKKEYESKILNQLFKMPFSIFLFFVLPLAFVYFSFGIVIPWVIRGFKEK